MILVVCTNLNLRLLIFKSATRNPQFNAPA
jgi:hypothetical protein